MCRGSRFFPNAKSREPMPSHMKGLWKHKKELKTDPNREKVRNHSSGDGKKKEEEIEAEDKGCDW